MAQPDIQYFAQDGTWHRPERAAAVDVIARGGGAGASPGQDGEAGWVQVKRFYAPDIPPEVKVEVGKGRRPGGRDGYALIITHLAEPGA